jgi:TRAP-type mannitol/chloroaromatic compound transport system permease small subunit
MEKFLRVIDRFSEWTGKGASFLVAFLILAIGYDITVRYLFATANQWAFDTVYMTYGGYTMLGVAYCHYLKGHVRMDLIYGRLSPRGKAITDSICYLFLFFPLFTVLLYKCGENALWSITSGERGSASVWRPLLGPFKLTITFGFLLFYLQGIAEFIRALTVAFKGESHES